MKYILLFLAMPVYMSSNCNKQTDKIPGCVQQKIAAIQAKPRYNPPAEVNEYVYNGQKVYLFTSDCCDQYIELFDSNCNYVCAPSGGLTGKGDGKCSDFYNTAQHVRLVWKDSR